MKTLVLSYPWACDRILEFEGSEYTNDPEDPGGPTRWGVTLNDVRKYVNPKAQASDVKSLSRQTAVEVYKKHYWDAVNGDELPFYMAYLMFDFGINAGLGRAIPFAAQCLNVKSKKVDKEFIKAAFKADPKEFITKFGEMKLNHYKSCKNAWKYLNGWTARTKKSDTYAKAIVLQFGVVKVNDKMNEETENVNEANDTNTEFSLDGVLDMSPEPSSWGRKAISDFLDIFSKDSNDDKETN